MKKRDKVWFWNWRGTIVTIFNHPQSHVRVAVVDLGGRPGLEINRPGLYWDGNMLPIALCYLSKEPK